ncbi:hypothetical protein [Plebeiibacterium marinum]|uniref:Uncharacterized protein n=1 Tax=Plebeiibacterium marinum TaxID=2992111 RepID=A0AAE3SJS4_9BACT|nr:hypothetical protein [Plebeiobacterium marinum]MCW3806045.1 hypothetical protein [Plebeiobacterium marinum]
MEAIKRIMPVLFVCAMFINGRAQTTKDLFTENNYQYVWLGVDYSKVKLIGDFYAVNMGAENPKNFIKDRYFKAWNDLIKYERQKFSVEKMLRKSSVTYDLRMMEAVNKTGSYESLEAETGVNLSADVLSQILSGYQIDYTDGIGIVIVAEYMDKAYVQASYVLEIFNIATREKLIEERFITKPVGFGVRNYWAGSLYYIFKEVTGKRYKAWKKQYK